MCTSPQSQRKIPTVRHSTFRHIKFENGYRSGLEAAVANQLIELGAAFEYETNKIPYQLDAKYIPDFILENGIIVECKGRFTSEDRRKMRLVKEQNPELDIRFVFTRSSSKINKGSKTSYGDWCTRYGFKYADKLIPEGWINEKLKESKSNKSPHKRKKANTDHCNA
jgi:hypothetical protein